MTLDLSKGVKFAVSWLHKRAEEMNDPHAKAILNSAAFSLGQQNASGRVELEAAPSGQAPLEGVKPLGPEVEFDDCPEGLFLFDGKHLGFMSEYATENPNGFRQRDAYVVESGEYFWGGVSNPRERAKLKVVPVAALLPASAEPVAREVTGAMIDAALLAYWGAYPDGTSTAGRQGMEAAIRAAISKLPPASGAVEAGWRLVPKEPTDEMIVAGQAAHNPYNLYSIWSAMLAAAPTEGR